VVGGDSNNYTECITQCMVVWRFLSSALFLRLFINTYVALSVYSRVQVRVEEGDVGM